MDEFIWANALWRVMNSDASETNRNRYVMKYNHLSELEATGSGSAGDTSSTVASTESGVYRPPFFEGQDYNLCFNSAGVLTYDLVDPKNKARNAVDYYYEHSIAPNFASDVQAVNLNNPTFTQFKSGVSAPEFAPGTWDSWEWWGSNNNTRFYTTIGGTDSKKQAFLASFGDITTLMGRIPDAPAPDVLKFTQLFTGASGTAPRTWLRSPGYNGCRGGVLNSKEGTTLNDSGAAQIYYSGIQSIRPCLFLLAP